MLITTKTDYGNLVNWLKIGMSVNKKRNSKIHSRIQVMNYELGKGGRILTTDGDRLTQIKKLAQAFRPGL